MEKKDILCPDCASNYISSKRFNEYGKCISCYRREIIAKTNNAPYVRYIDLPQEERDRLAHQRELNNKSYRLRKQKKKKVVNKKRDKVVDVKEAVTITRKNQIYTQDIIDELKQIANENTSINELLQVIKEKYPEKNFNVGNLNNIVRRHKLPYLQAKGKKSVTNTEEILVDNSNLGCNEDMTDVLSIDTVEATTEPIDLGVYEKPHIENEPERFKPIRAEIDGVLDKRFRNLGISVERDYTTDDYIKALDMLRYLKDNCDNIVKNRRSQQNVMNAYQSDMLHTIENVIADEGDTYLSDKMHIIRDYRRYFELDYKNVSTLRTIISKLDLDDLSNAIRVLQKNKNYVDNPVFKPYVDTTMIDKYDWVQPLDASSSKSSVSITKYNPMGFAASARPVTRIGMGTNTPPTSQLSSKLRKSLHKFRVSCKLSGGGYGAFRTWYRDYECTNSVTALNYATNTLKQLATTHKGMIWTDLDVVELNVDTVSAT